MASHKSFDVPFTLEMNELCFPRIRFLKSRIRNIIPRMKRILDFECNHPSQGIKGLRSDTEECQEIENLVKAESLVIRVLFTDENLRKYISPERLAVDQHNHPKNTTKKIPVDLQQLQKEVLVVAVEECRLKDLDSIRNTSFLSHAVITVFKSSGTSFKRQSWMTERENNKQFVVMYHEDVDITASSDTQQTHRNQPPSPSRLSPGNQPSSPVSAPPPRRGPPSPRKAQPSHKKPRERSYSGSPKALSPKNRSPSPMEVTNVKRSKHDTDALREQSGHDIAQTSTCPMETDVAAENCYTGPEQIPVLSTNRGLEKLRECIQFQLEVKTVHIIEKMIKLLTDVRNRREESARVSYVTILDKLIYEVEGLLSRSYTEHGRALRNKLDKQAINPNLRDELLGIEGMHGCGMFYHRVNLHLKQAEQSERDEVLKKIKLVMEKYKYTEKEYDTLFVQTELSRVGELVLCSV